jgi:hypothetical protein
MPKFAFNKPPREDKNKSKPDAIRQPSIEPKRFIRSSKSLSNSNDNNQQHASIFHRTLANPLETESHVDNTKPEEFPTRADKSKHTRSDNNINPGLRLRALVNAGKNAPTLKPQSKSNLLSGGERTRRAYWDVTTGVSLIINAILLATLIIMTNHINTLRATMNGLLSGLYGSLVEMDKVSLNTTITVDSQVPIEFMLPIQQNTDVILTQSVVIPNGYIVINSGGLSINAQASITLPAGTNLPVGLNIAVPVQTNVPITLQVPVNIPLAQTELHQPFISLQETVRAYYCYFDKNAQYPQGIYICKDHDIPSTTPDVP